MHIVISLRSERNPECISAGDRAGARARDRIGRPHAGMALGQVLGNRQRVPHDDVAVVQRGTSPVGENAIPG